jgi:uncharacterized protein (TIGR02453 family)
MTTTTTTYFSPATFTFLRDLAANNERAWFQENKARYERDVRDPATRFIIDFGPQLAGISKRFRADPRPVGGSLFRIHRDTRFSTDKRPYKTHAGVHFRHEQAKDAHAPGFYVHLEPDQVFVGVGIWHPDGATLKKIRDAIARSPAAWRKAVGDDAFRARFALAGDALKRPPAGYAKDHPLIEDLKRKDFIGVATFDEAVAGAPDFLPRIADTCRAGAPLTRFLCRAVGVPF